MVFHVIHSLKNKASHLTYNSFLYNWSLSNTVPDRMVVRPVDPWCGDTQKGQELLSAAGIGKRTGAQWYKEWWSPEDADDIWTSHMHGFIWLRDLRALDGALAREQGRLMIENWIDSFGNIWHCDSWRADLTGRRLSMWVCHYDFFCANASEEFEDKLLSSITKQAKHLSNYIKSTKGPASLEGVKGLLSVAIAFDIHHEWVEQALDALKAETRLQILPDGGHVSRSPATLLDALEVMVDIRIALNAGGYPIPEFLSDAISNMSCALRTMRYNDSKFGLFHGAQEGDSTTINAVLSQAGTCKKASKSLENTGFERVELGRSLLLMDTGKPNDGRNENTIHASALAFEFCYGKKRIFTSCGSHPVSKEWREALRATAAHNTLCLDYRNSCEIKKDGTFERKITDTNVQRKDTKDYTIIEACHNGYVALNGITHTRKLYLADEGHDLRGEDNLSCNYELIVPVETAVRFHLHPDVSASFISDGEEILLRIPGGIGWRFSRSVGMLALEDSLYLGDGVTPRKTKQIVIYGQMSEDISCVKWALKLEK